MDVGIPKAAEHRRRFHDLLLDGAVIWLTGWSHGSQHASRMRQSPVAGDPQGAPAVAQQIGHRRAKEPQLPRRAAGFYDDLGLPVIGDTQKDVSGAIAGRALLHLDAGGAERIEQAGHLFGVAISMYARDDERSLHGCRELCHTEESGVHGPKYLWVH